MNVAEPVFVPSSPVALHETVTLSPTAMLLPIVNVVVPVNDCCAPSPILYHPLVALLSVAVTLWVSVVNVPPLGLSVTEGS